jgi:N6-adenosine-specific RNA methylase IME4
VKRYRTIVADPPWPYPEGFGSGWNPSKPRAALPYGSMTLEDIAALPIAELADPDGAHLYLWTTTRYLRAAFDVLDQWGFRYGQTLVWAKPPIASFLGGAYHTNVEFVLFARRGTLRHLSKHRSSWWQWPRPGRGGHSRKPDAFLDLVEQVSPGPYVELFARRARFGWDYWGDQSLGTAELCA